MFNPIRDDLLFIVFRMLAGPGMKAQEIANLAWALAVMGEADDDLLKDLLRSAQAQRSDITLIESHQLYQVRCTVCMCVCMGAYMFVWRD